jgi:hypothetical protein
VIQEALKIEEDLNKRFHSQPRSKGEEFEMAKLVY